MSSMPQKAGAPVRDPVIHTVELGELPLPAHPSGQAPIVADLGMFAGVKAKVCVYAGRAEDETQLLLPLGQRFHARKRAAKAHAQAQGLDIDYRCFPARAHFDHQARAADAPRYAA